MFLKTNRPLRNASRAQDGVATLAVGGTDVPVTIRHQPRARRYNLRIVSASGEVVLTIPRGGSYDKGLDFLARHEHWLAERLERHPAPVPFAEGRLIPLRGIPHRLRIADRLRGAVVPLPSQGNDAVPGLEVPGGTSHAPRRLEEWLRKQAHGDLAEAVARHTANLGKPANGITVRDTRSRWGSCSSRSRLSFSWRLILAPTFVLDYVAAHEVAHLKEMNHGQRFWTLLDDLSPDVERAEAWLRDNGADLHRYGRAS